MLLLNDADTAACQQAVQHIYRDLAREVAGVRPPQGESAWIVQQEQTQLSEEFEHSLQEQIDLGKFDAGFKERAMGLLAKYGVNASILADQLGDELVEVVARAIVEQQRRFRHQLRYSVLPYSPHESLFAPVAQTGPGSQANEEGVGPTLAEGIDAFCKAQAPKWTSKTRITHRAKLKLLLDCFGKDRRISTITTADLWAFIEGVQRLRRNYHTVSGQSFLSRQTEVVTARITAVTATGILARAKSFFRFAHERGYCAVNPAQVLTVTKPKQQKGLKSRRSFKVPELEKLFSAPLFCGCMSKSRRFEPGAMVIKDAFFWVPLLAFYTGARLGELIQLRLDDVIVEGATPHISINEEGSTTADKKHVKTEAGVRLVPLHPELMQLGFADFVGHRRKTCGKHVRLFWEIAYGADGLASSTFSKWWGRAMDKMGLDDPALTFHSFRHTAEDFYKTSLTPKYLIDQIMGHSDQSSAGEYGVGIDIATAFKIVASLQLPVSVTAILGNSEAPAAQEEVQ